MGGGASKVDDLDMQGELMRRRGLASNDRNKLVLMSLNTTKLHAHATELHKLNVNMTKTTDKLVDQKTSFTKQLSVKSKTLKAKQAEIEQLKHAERLVTECVQTLPLLKGQLEELVAVYEQELAELATIQEAQKKGGTGLSEGAASGSAPPPAAAAKPIIPPVEAIVGGWDGSAAGDGRSLRGDDLFGGAASSTPAAAPPNNPAKARSTKATDLDMEELGDDEDFFGDGERGASSARGSASVARGPSLGENGGAQNIHIHMHAPPDSGAAGGIPPAIAVPADAFAV